MNRVTLITFVKRCMDKMHILPKVHYIIYMKLISGENVKFSLLYKETEILRSIFIHKMLATKVVNEGTDVFV